MRQKLSRETASDHCRTCLAPLHEPAAEIEAPGAEISINEELQKLLHLNLSGNFKILGNPDTHSQIDFEPWWPRKLCTECHELIRSFEKFLTTAEDSRQHLINLIKTEEFETDSEVEPHFEVVYEDSKDCPNSPETVAEPPDPVPEASASDPIAKKKGRPPGRKTRNNLKCSLCQHSFGQQLTLDAHVRKVHEGKKRPFQCDQCEKTYSFMGGLYTHIREVHVPQERRHTCDHPGCGRIYTSRVAMQKHKRLKHNPEAGELVRKYICEQCGASFNQSANLKFHRRTKHPTEDEVAAKEGGNGERYFCEPCQREFHSRYTLKYHTMQQHVDQGEQKMLPHECKVCGRRMAKRFMLLQHMLMHSSEKMPCERCGRQFARRFELEAHVRAVHLKLKPFACGHCSESFASRKTLRHHEYIHTGEKPYVCDTCGQAFRQQTCLKNHRKVHDN
ncbi:hypothetical protein KR018_000897 [Drosophila ironensis]|nr:hypothetical protein KR018_000897 [Drosophila ironensis]